MCKHIKISWYSNDTVFTQVFLKETIFPSKLSKTVSELRYKQGTQRFAHGRLRLSYTY